MLFSPEAEGSVIKEPKDYLLNIQLNFVVCLVQCMEKKSVLLMSLQTSKMRGNGRKLKNGRIEKMHQKTSHGRRCFHKGETQ